MQSLRFSVLRSRSGHAISVERTTLASHCIAVPPRGTNAQSEDVVGGASGARGSHSCTGALLAVD
jgi:hypothetical protein